MIRCNFRLLMLLIGLFISSLVNAHPLSPSLLKLTQLDEHTLNIVWKQPTKQFKGESLWPVLDTDCQVEGEPDASLVVGAIQYNWKTECSSSLVGKEVSINGLNSASTYVLLEFADLAGNKHFSLMDNNNDSFLIPKETNALLTAYEYLKKGLTHLLAGYDHILFILGLVTLLKSHLKTLVIALSCFTLGHTLAIIYSSFFSLPLPALVVEFLILASLIWLALEILWEDKYRFITTSKNPYWLTLAFGLVHGLGFAGAILSELNVSTAVAINILSFNLGVELGQLLVVILALPVISILMLRPKLKDNTDMLLGYGVGGASMFWMIQLFV